MSRAISPLRYPGGKTCLYDLLVKILKANGAERREYAEPFAGGCGLALSLLYGGHVSDIHINDIDPSIWAFWHCVLNRTDELVDRIENTPVTISEWRTQREIHRSADLSDVLELGFSAFFLNRTNRSGIIKGAGVIGGIEQKGNYKVDCRYNATDLARKVRRISKYRDRIHLTREDAIDFLSDKKRVRPETTFFCIDPPYFNKGSSLYTSFYDPNDHAELAHAVLDLKNQWIVTYDDADEIRKAFKDRRQFSFDIQYSVQTKRVGTELLIASKGLRIPKEVRERQVHRPQVRSAA